MKLKAGTAKTRAYDKFFPIAPLVGFEPPAEPVPEAEADKEAPDGERVEETTAEVAATETVEVPTSTMK